MVIRIWRTGVQADQVMDYADFARERSLPMFRQQPGYLGVMFAQSLADFAVVSLWRDQEAVDALEANAVYRQTVHDILQAGFLTGEQSIEVFAVLGGQVTTDLESALPALASR